MTNKVKLLNETADILEAESGASFQYGGSEIAQRFPEADVVLESLGFDGPYSASADDIRQAAKEI